MSYPGQLYTVRSILSSGPIGLPTSTEESGLSHSQGFPTAQQAFNQLSLPQSTIQSTSSNNISEQQLYSGKNLNTAPPSAGSSVTSTFNGSDRNSWMDSKDFGSPRTDQQSYPQKPQLSSHSPNYTANAPYGISSYPSTSSFTSQQDVQQHYQQYQQLQHTHHQQHSGQELAGALGKPMLSSQFKFSEPTDSVLSQQHNLSEMSYSQFLAPTHHHPHQHGLPQPQSLPQISHKHYLNSSMPGGIELPTSQLDQKFDELLSNSKQLTRKRTKNFRNIFNKPGQQDEFVCEHCGKIFAKNYNLKSHLKTHSDEKPFNCSFCSRKFARNHDRKRHELLHQGIKRFQCGGILKDNVTRWGCGKRFSRADGLSRHFKTDVGWLCVRPLMLEAKRLESNGANHDLEHSLGTNLDINLINELIKRK